MINNFWKDIEEIHLYLDNFTSLVVICHWVGEE